MAQLFIRRSRRSAKQAWCSDALSLAHQRGMASGVVDGIFPNCTVCMMPTKFLVHQSEKHGRSESSFARFRLRIGCKILENMTNGMQHSYDAISYLASHWSDSSGCCIISQNLNFVKLDSDQDLCRAVP